METYSYSKLSVAKECWYKYYLKYVLKVKTPFQNKPCFEKGKFLHSLLEKYPDIPSTEFKFPENIKLKEDFIKTIHNLAVNDKKLSYLLSEDVKLFSEYRFYLNENLQKVVGKKGSRLNGIVDYVGAVDDTLIICDWKSGTTRNNASLDQLKFYCIWAFTEYPLINTIKVMLYFFEQENPIVMETVERSEFEELKNYYFGLIETLETTTEWKKNKDDKCLRCDYYQECQPYKIEMKLRTKE